jgi:RsiW-degrading membrane proteinase PrsW (M82 family)
MGFLYLLLAFLPVLFYIGVIWSTQPIGSINFRNSLHHFLSGIISIGLIFTYFRIFPGCQKLLNINPQWSYLFFSFIQIALVEEISKFISFRIGETVRGETSVFYDKPIATMFYCGITGLGFAFIENVTYAMQYGGDVLLVRSFVAMLLHFLCGMIMGYWVSSSRMPTKIKNRSLFEVMCVNYPNFKKVGYYIIGIICAVFIHGLYDYNLFTKGHITSNYLILFSSAIAAYLAAKDLNQKSLN